MDGEHVVLLGIIRNAVAETMLDLAHLHLMDSRPVESPVVHLLNNMITLGYGRWVLVFPLDVWCDIRDAVPINPRCRFISVLSSVNSIP